MPVSQEPRWVPTSELPLDLLHTVRDGLVGEPRYLGVSSRYESPSWAAWVGYIALGIGVLVALVNPAVEGFGSFWRYGMLALAALCLGIYYSYKRAFGYAPSGQRLLVGNASLVLVDCWAVRVFPAELLTVQDFGSIVCAGETVCQGPHPAPWRDALRRAVERAKDPAQREQDRWRLAASRARSSSPAAPSTTPRLLPRLVAVAGALSVAVAVEAGPLHWRGAPLVAARRERTERYEREYRERYERENRERREREEARTREEQARRERRRTNAVTGSMDDVRDFLMDPTGETDEALTAARARLEQLCDEAYPVAPRLRGRQLVQARLLRAACSDPQRQLRYRLGGAYTDSIAQKVAEDVSTLANGTASPMTVLSAAWTGVPESESIRSSATCVPLRYGDPDYDASALDPGQRCTANIQLVDRNGDDVAGASYQAQYAVRMTTRYGAGRYGAGTGAYGTGRYGSGAGSYGSGGYGTGTGSYGTGRYGSGSYGTGTGSGSYGSGTYRYGSH